MQLDGHEMKKKHFKPDWLMDLSCKYVQDCYLVVHAMAFIHGTVAVLCEVDDIMKTSLVPCSILLFVVMNVLILYTLCEDFMRSKSHMRE